MQKNAEDLLLEADIKINGDRPWDIQVYNSDLYKRILSLIFMKLTILVDGKEMSDFDVYKFLNNV